MTLPDGASMKIYAVFGWTGEYSDRSEWPVDAWTTKRAAKARVKRLEQHMQKIGLTRGTRYLPGYDMLLADMRRLDPGFLCDYTGTRYHIVEITLRGNHEQV